MLFRWSNSFILSRFELNRIILAKSEQHPKFYRRTLCIYVMYVLTGDGVEMVVFGGNAMVRNGQPYTRSAHKTLPDITGRHFRRAKWC